MWETAPNSSSSTNKVTTANQPKPLMIFSLIPHRSQLLTKTSVFASKLMPTVTPPTSLMCCCRRSQTSHGRHTPTMSLFSTLFAGATSIFTTTPRIKFALWSSEIMPTSGSAQINNNSQRPRMKIS